MAGISCWAAPTSVTVTDVAAAQRDLPKLIAAQGAGLVSFDAGEFDLEDVFVELIAEAKR